MHIEFDTYFIMKKNNVKMWNVIKKYNGCFKSFFRQQIWFI